MNLPFYSAMLIQIQQTVELAELYEAVLVEDHGAHELAAVKLFSQVSRGEAVRICEAVESWTELRGWDAQDASLADLHERVKALQAAEDEASQADAEALDRLRTALLAASLPLGVRQALRATVKP
ncbi:hypothetical protein L6R49_28170 [Myxococcota bacterium]|nr:hypothetical protein [Myxococcota bacterium]